MENLKTLKEVLKEREGDGKLYLIRHHNPISEGTAEELLDKYSDYFLNYFDVRTIEESELCAVLGLELFGQEKESEEE